MKRFFIFCLIALCSVGQKASPMRGQFNPIFKVKQHGLVIRDYRPECDKPLVVKIARQSIGELTNLRWYGWDKEKAVYDDVIPVLDDHGRSGRRTLVCCKNDQLIGFINYKIYAPLFSERIKQYTGYERVPRAKIIHLAVDRAYQSNGTGSALMEEIIDDCSEKGVNVITLCTVGRGYSDNLPRFYRKFGFYLFQEPMPGSPADTQWKRKNKPGFFETTAERVAAYFEAPYDDEWCDGVLEGDHL